MRVLFRSVGNAQANAAVVQQQVGADLERLEDLRVRQARAGGVAGLALQLEPETAAGLEPHRTAGEGSDPQLRPLQVGDDPDRPSQLPLQAADRLQPDGMLLMGAQAEVQPGQVQALGAEVRGRAAVWVKGCTNG